MGATGRGSGHGSSPCSSTGHSGCYSDRKRVSSRSSSRSRSRSSGRSSGRSSDHSSSSRSSSRVAVAVAVASSSRSRSLSSSRVAVAIVVSVVVVVAAAAVVAVAIVAVAASKRCACAGYALLVAAHPLQGLVAGAARPRLDGAGVVDDREAETTQARIASPQQARLRGANAGRMAADDHIAHRPSSGACQLPVTALAPGAAERAALLRGRENERRLSRSRPAITRVRLCARIGPLVHWHGRCEQAAEYEAGPLALGARTPPTAQAVPPVLGGAPGSAAAAQGHFCHTPSVRRWDRASPHSGGRSVARRAWAHG